MADIKLDTLKLEITDNAETTAKHLEKLKKQLKDLVPQQSKQKLDTYNGSFKDMSKNFNSLANSMRGFKSLLTTAFVGLTGSKFFKESSNFVETLNLFHVTMREGTKAAYEYGEVVQSVMGIDIKEWMDYQGRFQNLANGYGLASDKAAIMSKNLTQLSYDLGSVFNVDTEKAYEKLQSAMSGQVKALKSWGVDVSVASMKQYALNKGIEQSWTSLSVGTQAMLRYNYILEKTQGLQGDLARTLMTPANAIRILKSQITQFERAIGNILSLVITRAIPYFQAFIELLKESANELATLWGYDPNSFVDWSNLDTTEVTESIEETTEAAKELKRTLLGFDEINKLNGASGSGSGNGYNDLDIALNEYDFLGQIDRSQIDTIKDKLREFIDFIKEIAQGIKNIWDAAIEPLWGLFVTDGFEAFAVISGIAGVLGSLKYGKVATGVGAIASAFLLSVDAGKKFAKVINGDNDSLKGAMLDLVGVSIGIAGGFLVGGPVGALIGGLGALATVFITAQIEDYKLKKQLSDIKIYENNGVAIQDLQADIENYLGSLGLAKEDQEKWIATIKLSEDAYKDAATQYDNMWQQLSTKSKWETTDIDNLTTAFNNLAESIKAVRDARIESAMESVSNAIKNNISPELSDKLDSLISKMTLFQEFSNIGISDLQKQWNDVVSQIVSQKGSPTTEQRETLTNIRSQLMDYSLSTNEDRTKWNTAKKTFEGIIYGGANATEVKEAILELQKARKTYLAAFNERMEGDYETLSQMIKKDKWGIFEEGDLATFEQSWKDQANEIAKDFNSLLDSYLTQLTEDAKKQLGYIMGMNTYKLGTVTPGFWEMGVNGRFNVNLLGHLDRDFSSAVASYNELLDLIDLISGASAHAVGGFPEDGLFFANHNELVGKFVNGRTAVANNEQIIEGIKRGVSEANRESGGGGNWTIQILDPNGNITGETIITAAERRNRRDGKTVISIGA